MPVNLYYRGADCPCSAPIPDDKEEGDECDECGHIFSESFDADEPEEGDYTTDDYCRFYQFGKLVLNLKPEDDHVAALKAHMDKEGFFPNVFHISDHGNVSLVDMK